MCSRSRRIIRRIAPLTIIAPASPLTTFDEVPEIKAAREIPLAVQDIGLFRAKPTRTSGHTAGPERRLADVRRLRDDQG